MLAGCSVGRPSGFVARSNRTCADASKRIAALSTPRDPTTALAYALGRYTAVEYAVSALTDASLPGGAAGQALRDRWLGPARASLHAADAPLDRLRDAARHGDRAGASVAFTSAATAGTRGVDTDLLRSRELTDCASLFTPAAPATAW